MLIMKFQSLALRVGVSLYLFVSKPEEEIRFWTKEFLHFFLLLVFVKTMTNIENKIVIRQRNIKLQEF